MAYQNNNPSVREIEIIETRPETPPPGINRTGQGEEKPDLDTIDLDDDQYEPEKAKESEDSQSEREKEKSPVLPDTRSGGPPVMGTDTGKRDKKQLVIRLGDNPPVDLNDIWLHRIVPAGEDPDAFSISTGQFGFTPRDTLQEWVSRGTLYAKPYLFAQMKEIYDRKVQIREKEDIYGRKHQVWDGTVEAFVKIPPITGQIFKVVSIIVWLEVIQENDVMIKRIASMLHTEQSFRCDRCREIEKVFVADVDDYHYIDKKIFPGGCYLKMTLRLIDLGYKEQGTDWSAFAEYRRALRKDALEDEYTKTVRAKHDESRDELLKHRHGGYPRILNRVTLKVPDERAVPAIVRQSSGFDWRKCSAWTCCGITTALGLMAVAGCAGVCFIIGYGLEQ